MTKPLPRRAALVLLACLAAVTAVVGTVAPARAAARVVTLTSSGPSPASLTIAAGDVVTFSNTDTVSHRVRRSSGAWSFDQTVPAGRTATTAPFRSAGTYGYTDTFTLIALPQTANGSIVVKAAAPAPSPSATASPRPSPRPSASARPSSSPAAAVTAAPSASPQPTASGVGVAALPGLLPGALPTGSPGPSASAGPLPDVAALLPSATPSATVDLGYSRKGLVQPSAHRYGLPAALAVVAITGVLSLVVRLLLAHPAASSSVSSPVSRRTAEG